MPCLIALRGIGVSDAEQKEWQILRKVRPLAAQIDPKGTAVVTAIKKGVQLGTKLNNELENTQDPERRQKLVGDFVGMIETVESSYIKSNFAWAAAYYADKRLDRNHFLKMKAESLIVKCNNIIDELEKRSDQKSAEAMTSLRVLLQLEAKGKKQQFHKITALIDKQYKNDEERRIDSLGPLRLDCQNYLHYYDPFKGRRIISEEERK